MAATGWLLLGASVGAEEGLQLGEHQTLEARGLSVLLHHNAFHQYFGDQKMAGLELVMHGRRVATNGEVRLLPTPEQWDPIPTFERREVDAAGRRLTAHCSYPKEGVRYRLDVAPEGDGLRVAVHLEAPLPAALHGRAGFNLEFLPGAYFGRTWALDDRSGLLPRYPGGGMHVGPDGVAQALPLARGRRLLLAPEDPLLRVEIASESGELQLLDGRTRAQNGWFVVRTLLPADKTIDALVWRVRPNRVAGWTRPPVIAHSQVGYHPAQEKVAVLELDPRFTAPNRARLMKLQDSGDWTEAFGAETRAWGRWQRYDYAHFDFSSVRAPGIYAIEYAGQRTEPFPIAEGVYRDVWKPSLDTFLAVQMDHVAVREGYRIWHGLSHMDDARQAPVDHTHFDGYAQPATTDTAFAPGQHIPGLDQGGWYDAGDFDIRTQSQVATVVALALAIEDFGVDWDATRVDVAARQVEIRRPDGVSDAVQQVRHGAIALLAQFRAVGHAIPGIVAPTLEQYTHLGDGGSKTDNLVYAERLGPLEREGRFSGRPDDRWAFTTRTTALQYGAAAGLAAASRVLRDHDPALAKECLETAERAWAEEHDGRAPGLFRSFNTTGGNPGDEELRAAVELLLATRGAEVYRKRLAELLPEVRERLPLLAWTAARALPFMDDAFRDALRAEVAAERPRQEGALRGNPFGVPISGGTWGGAGAAVGFAVSSYYLHRAFPDLVGPEATLRGVEYVLGRHPVSNLSLVSAVGARSQLEAYGSNRADESFIAGGLVPGVVLVQPDLPELTEGWPFLWYEGEYVITAAASFILAANAADALLR